jgi:hypothetical protein
VDEFLKLHILFHQLDAGSYPTLESLFQEKGIDYASHLQNRMDELRTFVTKTTTIHQTLENLLKEVTAYTQKPNNRNIFAPDPERDALRNKILQFFSLIHHIRLECYYSGDHQKALSLAALRKPLEDSAIHNFFSRDDLEALLNSLNHPDDPAQESFHGSTSGVFVGLATINALIPSGYASTLGLANLSGELREGTSADGVSRSQISWAPAQHRQRAHQYATLHDVVFDQKALHFYKRNTNPFVDRTFYDQASQTVSANGLAKLSRSDLMSLGSYLQGIVALPHDIKKVKVMRGYENLDDLASRLKKDLFWWKEIEKTEPYKSLLPKEEGGYNHDDYYKNGFSLYKGLLQESIEALTKPLSPLRPELIRSFLSPSFPVMFSTTLPTEVINPKENVWAGPLALGKDPNTIYVPEIHIPLVQKWVDTYVLGQKKPPVRALVTQ